MSEVEIVTLPTYPDWVTREVCGEPVLRWGWAP